MIERDYIMRMIKQLAGVLARIIKAKEQEQYDEALQIINEAHRELFGLDSQLVGIISAESLVQLLGDHQKIKAVAKLFKEEGDLQLLKGDEFQARSKYQRSIELFLEAIAAQSRQDPESVAAIKSLTNKVDVVNLAEKHLTMLKKVSA